MLKNAVNALTQTRHSATQSSVQDFQKNIFFSFVKAEKCVFSVCVLHLSHDVTAAKDSKVQMLTCFISRQQDEVLDKTDKT